MQEQQMEACNALIEEKNKLISDFKAELTNNDMVYAKDLKRWAQDIDLLVERMETQFRTAALTYRQELLQIEHAFDAERADCLKKHEDEWQAAINQKREMEEEFLKKRAEMVDDFDKQLDIMRRQDAEDYNIIKAKLENEVQLLEQQLQLMKATYQLNQEKLEYNLQVLKKREEENAITINLQKRKLTKLHDTLNRLQQKMAKQERQYGDDNESLTADYERISDLLQQLMRKANQFIQADNEKFREVWLMNEEECKVKVKRLIDISRILSEQQLGLNYEEPAIDFSSPLSRQETRASAKQRSAQEIVKTIMDDVKEASNRLTPTEEAAGMVVLRIGGADGTEQVAVTSSTVKTILELICDESGFLIEEKLQTLLLPLEKDDRNLIKLDAIFHALKIEKEEDVGILANYFLQMKNRMEEDEADAEVKAVGGEQEETQEDDEGMGEGEGEAFKTEVELIHPNSTLCALRNFIEEFQRYRNSAEQQISRQEFQLSLSDIPKRDKEADSSYWSQFSNFPVEKDAQVWNSLLISFEKYQLVVFFRLFICFF